LKMKKVIALVLSVILVVLMVASCGDAATTGTTVTTKGTENTSGTAGNTTAAATTTKNTTNTTNTTNKTTEATVPEPIVPKDESLLIWLDFAIENLNEDTDTPYFIDVSGNENHGYIGGNVFVTEGFDGISEAAQIYTIGDYVTIKHNDVFNFTAEDEYSIDFWFQVDTKEIYSHNAWPCLFTKGSPSATNYFGCWINRNNKGVDSVNYGTGTFNVTTNTNDAAMTGTLDKEWHRFIAVQKDGQIYTYIDGKAGAVGTAKDVTNTWDIYLGGKVGEDEQGADKIQQFFGAIDEFKIYNRALTTEEITGIYPVEKDSSKLVVDLDFSEIKNGVIEDKSGKGNNATVTGDVSIADGAVVFDTEGEYLTIKNSDDINFAGTDNFIIEFKYRIDDASNAGSWPCLLSKGDKNMGWYGIWMNGGIKWGGDTGNHVTTPSMATGEWHTIQVVRDASAKVIYVFIDGSIATQIATVLSFESTLDLFIGGNTYSGSGTGTTTKVQQFFGAIDDFKVYDYGTDALTYSAGK